MGEKVYILNDKSVLFAIRIIKLYKYISVPLKWDELNN